LECERMAARERKRRDEHKKNKDKGKGKATNQDDGNGAPLAPAGARRSARNNGLQPELSITDPVKLERRLKRQRSDGVAGTDSHGSEEENSDSRDAKRTKTVNSEDEGDRDPLDTLGPLDGPPRPHAVRFAPEIEPMQEVHETMPAYDGQLNVAHDGADMVVDPPRQQSSSSGFARFLLNPMPENDNSFLAGPSSSNFASSSGTSIMNQMSTSDPFLSQPMPMTPPVTNSSPPHTPIRKSKSLEPEQRPSSPIPVIERSPTPPLPDFHADTSLISAFETTLRDRTASFTIEQLEQLRATCLGKVWRHRSDWDRDALIRELQDFVDGFIDEVGTDNSDVDN